MLETCPCPLVSWLLRRHEADNFSNLDVTIVDYRLHIPNTEVDGRYQFLVDPNIIIHVKRIAAGAIMTMNSSSDADGK